MNCLHKRGKVLRLSWSIKLVSLGNQSLLLVLVITHIAQFLFNINNLLTKVTKRDLKIQQQQNLYLIVNFKSKN